MLRKTISITSSSNRISDLASLEIKSDAARSEGPTLSLPLTNQYISRCEKNMVINVIPSKIFAILPDKLLPFLSTIPAFHHND